MPVHSATEVMAKDLLQLWKSKTPLQAREVLAKPDVSVTNQKDKAPNLALLDELDERVRKAWEKEEKERTLLDGAMAAVASRLSA